MNILSFNIIADFINKEVNSRCGLNISQMRLLLFFDKTENQKITMGQLAKEMRISLSTLSRQLQQKNTVELVEIVRSQNNTSKKVHLTQVGVAKAQELKNTLEMIEDGLFSCINTNNVPDFTKNLKLVAHYSSLN